MDNQIALLDQFATNIFGTSVQTKVCLIWEYTLSKIKTKETKKKKDLLSHSGCIASRDEEMGVVCLLLIYKTYIQGTVVPPFFMRDAFQEPPVNVWNLR